mmetsp:Transcript_42820/g.107010  ORF Transcript_42820/g.107010 Transcript_42820/m.107010 type:complete len:110 (+) Transcript_42820:1214-1543(+)
MAGRGRTRSQAAQLAGWLAEADYKKEVSLPSTPVLSCVCVCVLLPCPSVPMSTSRQLDAAYGLAFRATYPSIWMTDMHCTWLAGWLPMGNRLTDEQASPPGRVGRPTAN